MSKNILIFSGSPRKGGNSDLLCDEFLRGAQEAGHRVEKLRLEEKTIHYCTGCGTCFSEQGRCAQQDDMNELLEKMLAADVIVMSTPVYFYTMNGQMKTLIDRTCPVYTLLRDKDMYFMMVAAEDGEGILEPTIQAFRAFTSCLSGIREVGVIHGTGAWNPGDIRKTPAMAQAYEMGRNA